MQPTNLNISRSDLINLCNREVGYNVEHINYGDTARISERGNLVIEHNSMGTEDTIKFGNVVSRNEPLHKDWGAQSKTVYPGHIDFALRLFNS